MKIYRNLDDFIKLDYPVVTTGTFDGVHLAHQKILSRVKEIAKQKQGESVLLTYWPHPRIVLNQNAGDLKLINTLDEKIELLSSFKLDNLLIMEFTKEFSSLTSGEFIRNILINGIGVKKLVIGYNHHFGKNREGSLEYLKKNSHEFGFEVEEIPEQDLNDVAVSSTKIRESLEVGNITLANTYLGYDFYLTGKVIKKENHQENSLFLISEFNLNDPLKIVPDYGLYAVIINFHQKKLKGMLQINTKNESAFTNRTFQIYIFNNNIDLHEKQIKINFIQRLRDEKKFNNNKELSIQFETDKEKALAILQ